MPIGLAIGSRTPEEIAVSVIAELISVMNTRDPDEGFPPGMAEELAAGTKGVLAMIVKKEGEAPRRPGTKMLVREDGSFLGTVGGGYAEAVILEAARKMISKGQPETRLIRVSMKKGTMYCGGEITVFLTRAKGREEA
jgi:xanthine dehydrogenase accessory factor